MIIKELKLRNYPYKTRRGLAEKIAKRYFEKHGYEVFRGRMLLGREYSMNYEYENVRKKYERLERILYKKLRLKLLLIRGMLKEINGIPDFFLYKHSNMLFVEVKLEHEALKNNQIECIKILEDFGFKVMLLRIKSKPYRVKEIVDLKKSVKLVLEKQIRIKHS